MLNKKEIENKIKTQIGQKDGLFDFYSFIYYEIKIKGKTVEELKKDSKLASLLKYVGNIDKSVLKLFEKAKENELKSVIEYKVPLNNGKYSINDFIFDLIVDNKINKTIVFMNPINIGQTIYLLQSIINSGTKHDVFIFESDVLEYAAYLEMLVYYYGFEVNFKPLNEYNKKSYDVCLINPGFFSQNDYFKEIREEFKFLFKDCLLIDTACYYPIFHDDYVNDRKGIIESNELKASIRYNEAYNLLVYKKDSKETALVNADKFGNQIIGYDKVKLLKAYNGDKKYSKNITNKEFSGSNYIFDSKMLLARIKLSACKTVKLGDVADVYSSCVKTIGVITSGAAYLDKKVRNNGKSIIITKGNIDDNGFIKYDNQILSINVDLKLKNSKLEDNDIYLTNKAQNIKVGIFNGKANLEGTRNIIDLRTAKNSEKIANRFPDFDNNVVPTYIVGGGIIIRMKKDSKIDPYYVLMFLRKIVKNSIESIATSKATTRSMYSASCEKVKELDLPIYNKERMEAIVEKSKESYEKVIHAKFEIDRAINDIKCLDDDER